MIRAVRADDHAAIFALVSAAFGRADEAHLVEALRADGDALVELVFEDDGALVGQVLFSPMGSDTGERLAALAPLAVAPSRQRQGGGGALIAAGLEVCRGAGVETVIVLGDPAYYERHGFSAALAAQVMTPFSGPHLMAARLTDGEATRPMTATYAKAFRA